MITYYSPEVKDEFDKEISMNFEAGKIYMIDGKEVKPFYNMGRFSNLE